MYAVIADSGGSQTPTLPSLIYLMNQVSQGLR